MKKLSQQVVYLLLLILCLSHCDDDSGQWPNESIYPITDARPQVFLPKFLEDLEVGHQWLYVRYAACCLGSPYEDTYYDYTLDTLILELLEVDSNRFLIKEYFSAGSHSLLNDAFLPFTGETNKVFENYWLFQDSILLIEGVEYSDPLIPVPSQFSYLLSVARFNFDICDDVPIDIVGWQTSLGDDVKKYTYCANDFELFNYHYAQPKVNIYNKGLVWDSFGTTTIYNWNEGIIRTSVYTDWGGHGLGWDLLPD